MTSALTKKIKLALQLKSSHIFIIGLALTIGIALISTQRFFVSNINATLLEKSAQLLTADIEIASTKALSDEDLSKIEDRLPSHAKSYRQVFTSMVQFYGQQTHLVEVMAIQKNYPLRGECLAINADGNTVALSDLITSTENAVVISEELYNTTNLTFGSTLNVGDFKGVVVGIVSAEPDINIQAFRMGPRIYMNYKNLSQLGFDQSLSRIYHSLFIRFHSPEIADQWVDSLNTTLGIEGNKKTIQGSYGPSQPVVVRSFRDINLSIFRGFSFMNQFFLFLSLFILLLSAAAFGFITWSSIVQKLPDIGNLRYLGINNHAIQRYYKNLTLPITVTLLGLIIGFGLAQACAWLMSEQMNIPYKLIKIQPIDIAFISFISIAGLRVIVSIALNLTNTSHPFGIEQPKKVSLNVMIQLGLAVLIFIGFFLAINQVPVRHIFGLIALFLSVFFTLGLLDALIFSNVTRLPLKKFSLPIRLAFTYLSRGHTIRRMAFISIGLSLMVIFSILNYETSLNKEFNPESQNLPSLFIIDMYRNQTKTLAEFIPNYELSPLIKTRITKINKMNLANYKKTRLVADDYFLHREQNLSTRSQLNSSETLIEGAWFKPNNQIIELSIEERFAKKLNIQLNDEIEFYFFDQPLVTVVTSIRAVDWSSFTPNFFMIVESPYADYLPQTWVGAIFTSSTQEHQQFQAELASRYPNISIIDIKSTRGNILKFFKTFTLAFKLGSFFCFFIGSILFVLLGKLYTDIRKHTTHMLIWIGCSKRDVELISLIENIMFVSVAFICASSISIGLCFILFKTLIPIPLIIQWWAMGGVYLGLLGIVWLHWKLSKTAIA
jgi:putative ABC transport system permease protein